MAFQSRTPTLGEKNWMECAGQIGCIVCELYHNEDTPAGLHHMEGKVKKGAHMKTIPLCDRHHQIKDNHCPPRWLSRHGDGKKAFEKAYCSEVYLWEETKERVLQLLQRTV